MLKIYNTLTRTKQIFKPRQGRRVKLFICGPTVYDHMHIGHAKTYIQFDVIVKYLRYSGYNVYYLQNITDLDDKIISRAKDLKTIPLKLARKFEKSYHEDEKSMGIDSVTKYARATDYIDQIIKQVKVLVKKGYAYKIEDGYYYNIKKFKDYGKLSRRTAIGAEDAVTRIDENIQKKNKGDFCLWKFSKKHEPEWDTDIGKGRPGWHIEDTAITEKNFGFQYDIHAGARDLIFPHHEAEIAQMEAVSGKKPLVKYWMHTGFLNVDGYKMSKSLKNFITVKQALKIHNYKVLRFFYLASHYRSPIDFTNSSLQKAKNSLERLNDFIQYTKTGKKDNLELVKQTKKEFLSAMDDDFDTVKALAVIFDLVKKSYKQNTGGKKTYELLKDFNKVFEFFDFERKEIPKNVMALVKQREKLRKQKKWSQADQIRKKIEKLGFIVEDAFRGSLIKNK